MTPWVRYRSARGASLLERTVLAFPRRV